MHLLGYQTGKCGCLGVPRDDAKPLRTRGVYGLTLPRNSLTEDGGMRLFALAMVKVCNGIQYHDINQSSPNKSWHFPPEQYSGFALRFCFHSSIGEFRGLEPRGESARLRKQFPKFQKEVCATYFWTVAPAAFRGEPSEIKLAKHNRKLEIGNLSARIYGKGESGRAQVVVSINVVSKGFILE
jgi:hypothetical protein